MKANFDKAFNKVIKAEGGYSRDPDDKGGETYLGIARKFHSKSKMWDYIDIIKFNNPKATYKALTTLLKKDKRIDDEAKKIYKEQYWDKMKCGEITSQRIAEQLFDMGVNSGISNAVKLMQGLIGMDKSGYISDGFISNINNYVARTRLIKR